MAWALASRGQMRRRGLDIGATEQQIPGLVYSCAACIAKRRSSIQEQGLARGLRRLEGFKAKSRQSRGLAQPKVQAEGGRPAL